MLIAGTGLTMIDVILSLEAGGFRGRITALSRHGLLPRPHAELPPWQPIAERPAGLGTALLRATRTRASVVGWRAAVDELRPFTQGIWQSASLEEQRRFLRHLRAWWDVHRHRIAPSVAGRLAALRASGRFEVLAGRLLACRQDGDGLAVGWRPRHGGAVQRRRVRRIVNCTGPSGDVSRTGDPLLRSLYASGRIRPDRHQLGIDVTSQSEVIDATGRPNPRLLALGPMTRGAFWEIVAVPDIRRQTWMLARHLAHAQWTGGEGL